VGTDTPGGLGELAAFRITEIPRRVDSDGKPRPTERDAGRMQRVAALVAAYHGGVAREQGRGTVAFGWVREKAGGPVSVLVTGAALSGGALPADAAGRGAVALALPGGARGQPLHPGELTAMLEQLQCWRAIAGISDSLLATDSDQDHPAPSLDECLLPAWPGAFGWLVVAAPVPATELAPIAGEVAEQQRMAAGMSERFPERAVVARRLEHRHAELRQAFSTGLWRLRILAGGADAEAAARIAGLVCASADTGGLPYALVPAGKPATLRELLGGTETPASRETAAPGGDPATGEASASWPFLGSTYLLAALARTPEAEVPGVRLALRPDFDVTQESALAEGIALGVVLDRQRMPAGDLRLPLDSLNRHVFVCGATGSGKSQTVRGLLEAASGAGIPWLVVEPAKAEYRLMSARLGEDAPEVVRIRPGEADAIAAGINPLEPAWDADGNRFPLQTHADFVRALFLASFAADDPFPQVLSAALTRVYEEGGWDLALGEPVTPGHEPGYPSLSDLQRAAERVVGEIGYGKEIAGNVRGFIKVRLSSLRLGTTGRFLDGGHPVDFGALLTRNAVLEIEDVGDDRDKAFLMGTVLIRLTEHLRLAQRRKPGPPGLKHITVLEEAHRLLRRDDSAGRAGGAAVHAVEMFAGLLAEIRAYGEGLIIAEQIPARLIPDVIKNTAVKITHRLPAADDREAVGATMNLTGAQSAYLVTLAPGEGAVCTDGMDYPLLVRMPDGTAREAAAHPVTATPRAVVSPRSGTCGAACQASPCTLRDMRVAQHALSRHPGIVLWAELAVVAHLTGWAMPVPEAPLLDLLRETPERIRDCAFSHAIDAAVAARSPVISARLSPSGLAQHVTSALRARVAQGTWSCPQEEPQWLAPAYQWALILDALKSADRKAPGAGRHPRTGEWERACGQPIPGDTVARQVGAVQRWYDSAQRDAGAVRAVAFGVAQPSAIELAAGASADDDDFEEHLNGQLAQFIDCRWPLLYLTGNPPARRDPMSGGAGTGGPLS
jgi:hypothetical protein